MEEHLSIVSSEEDANEKSWYDAGGPRLTRRHTGPPGKTSRAKRSFRRAMERAEASSSNATVKDETHFVDLLTDRQLGLFLRLEHRMSSLPEWHGKGHLSDWGRAVLNVVAQECPNLGTQVTM